MLTEVFLRKSLWLSHLLHPGQVTLSICLVPSGRPGSSLHLRGHLIFFFKG